MRDTHMLALTKMPTDKEKEAPIFIVCHNIQSIVPQADGTTLIVTGSMPFHVKESVSEIIRLTKAVGILTVLK